MIHIFIFLLSSFSLFSQTCSPEASMEWILSEFESEHPQLILQKLNVDKIQAKKAEASKFINPEIEHFSVWGKEFGNVNAYNNETRLWFTLQLAGQRGKSIQSWAKESQMVKQEEILLRQALLKDLWLNFFRLHQIYKELSVKKIIISKLQKVLVNYNARKFLSPDMRLEERIFSMVTKNFSLVQDLLERERIGILSFFTEITSYQCPILKIKSEDTDINWPKLARLSALTQIEPLPLKLAKSEFEFAESQIRLAESRKVPPLRFGSVTQSFVSDEVNNTMSGIAFVMPLPFFDRNQTQRLQTILDERYANRRVAVTKLKEDFIFETNLKKYKSGLAVLTQVGEIDRSLEVMEKLANSFSEGKVSIPNIVEFCRQLDDLVSRYHGGESALMRDLLDLYEQRGLLSKETLQEML